MTENFVNENFLTQLWTKINFFDIFKSFDFFQKWP